MKFSSQEFADFTGISKKSVNNYRERGMPYVKKNKYYYYTFEAIQWLYDNGIKTVAGSTDFEVEEQTPKYRKDLAEAKLKEHTLALREGKYILISEVKDEYFKIGRMTRDAFQGLSNKVSHLLLNKSSKHDVKKIIDKEVEKILTELIK